MKIFAFIRNKSFKPSLLLLVAYQAVLACGDTGDILLDASEEVWVGEEFAIAVVSGLVATVSVCCVVHLLTNSAAPKSRVWVLVHC